MKIRILLLSLMAVAISACSSSGSSTVNITSSNAGSIARTADSATAYAGIAQSLGGMAGAYDTRGGITKWANGVSPQSTGNYACSGGGSISYDSTYAAPTYSFSLTYSQCTYGTGSGSLVIDGSASGSSTSNAYGGTDWQMSMPSLSFIFTGTQSFDMNITNYSIAYTDTSSTTHTVDYSMTMDSSVIGGSFSLNTTTPLGYDDSSYSGLYPISGVLHVSANGTADITYYNGGFTITTGGATISCPNYICQ